MIIKDIYDFIDSFAPFSTQCEWDNAGLLVGDMNSVVNKIGFALDATAETVNSACENNCDLMITHHPVIFHPLKSVNLNNPVYKIIENKISIICAHTNLDKSDKGVNRVLAETIGLRNLSQFESDNDSSMCFIGEIDEISGEDFSYLINSGLNTKCKYYSSGKEIRKVAVCGGAGGEFLYDIFDKCDAFITGEVKHHEFLDAASLGLSIYEAGHYETEFPVMNNLKEAIEKKFEISCVLLNQSKPAVYCGD